MPQEIESKGSRLFKTQFPDDRHAGISKRCCVSQSCFDAVGLKLSPPDHSMEKC